MNKKIIKFLETTFGQLGFALFAGLGYLGLVSGFIVDLSRGMWLMLLYVSPIIVCGSAIVIIKLIKYAREAENTTAVLKIFWIHIFVIIMGIVFVVEMF